MASKSKAARTKEAKASKARTNRLVGMVFLSTAIHFPSISPDPCLLFLQFGMQRRPNEKVATLRRSFAYESIRGNPALLEWAPKLLSESESSGSGQSGWKKAGIQISPMPSIETHCVAGSSSSLASALLICSSVGRAKCSLRDATSSNFGARNALTLASWP